MEDTHICISDLTKKFGCNLLMEEPISFYGVSLLPTILFLCFLTAKKNLCSSREFHFAFELLLNY